MRRTALYSRSPGMTPSATPDASAAAATPADAATVASRGLRVVAGAFARRHERWLGIAAGLLAGALAVALWMQAKPAPRALTQKDIDGAVLHTLANKTLPSRAAKAYEAIRPSVVRVVGSGYPEDAARDDRKDGKGSGEKGASKPSAKPDGKTPTDPGSKRAEARPPAAGQEKPGAGKDKGADKGKGGLPENHPDVEKGTGVGTGVVIVDKGIILTNLHVVLGASKLKVIFHEGTESEATVIGMQPEHDLAVLRATKLPDDLQAAVLRSTADLVPGDEVVAVGFPFGIGPSASAGVISGLKREYRSSDGKRILSNLIQFDAAANPGNSGGPLVTMDGEVVGIVTAILNPTEQRVFVGIGFAVPIENAAAGAGMSPF